MNRQKREGMKAALEEAVRRCQAGDVDALEPIYRHYRGFVFRLCSRMAGDQARAADWTQEVFIRVFERIRSFRGKADFSTWLYRVATNYCLDQLKRKEAQSVPLENVPEEEGGENPLEVLARSEERALLEAALSELSPGLRAVLVLKDLEQLSYAEISRILGIPEGTVGSRLNQARKQLARHLVERFPEARGGETQGNERAM